MPLSKRASKKTRSFDLPVSYKVNETRDRLRDALNVMSNQGRLETRFGRSRYNSTSLGGSVLSTSFFKNASNTRYLLAKVGSVMYSVASAGAHTSIKTGLTSTTKHRALTWARGTSSRHIIAIENDGLYQWNGTTFGQLGQAAPAAASVATMAGALTNGTYKVVLSFYASSTGFETNATNFSSSVTTAAQGIAITSIPATAANPTIDTVKIYLKNTASAADPVYAGEVSLGTTTYNITADPTSTDTPPEANGAPVSGGAKYLTEFNRRLVYAGNSTYPSDVFFSEEDLPDAFNDGTAAGHLVLYTPGDGPITGLATGLYNNSVLDPYLVVFKKRSIHIYSEIGGEGKFTPISKQIGCVSHDTIQVKNGNVFFLSDQGWRVIENGRLMVDEKGNPATLGLGDIDDIFRAPGYVYEVNRSQLGNAFSVYYSTLDQYMTWTAEGSNTSFTKTYVYEFNTGGFKPWQFYSAATCACVGEDSAGDEVVFMADSDGYLYTHSSGEDRNDDDNTGTNQTIDAFAMMTWLDGDDMDASYNFRELILRRVAGSGDLTVKTWINYIIDNLEQYALSFANPSSGLILDEDYWDEGIWGDERTIVTARQDINRVGENILIGFYQNAADANINLVNAQLDFSRNGNRN
jgi:hypothetical protein